MKNIHCVVCGVKISPFIQTWKEFLDATIDWKKYYCLGEKQHSLYLCPEHWLVKCPECGEPILSEKELNELNAEASEWDTRNRM